MLVAPEACHESDVRCLAVRRQFVNVLLEKGLLKVVTELQDTVEDNLFGVSLTVFSSPALVVPATLQQSACRQFTAAGVLLVAARLDTTSGGCLYLHWKSAECSDLLQPSKHLMVGLAMQVDACMGLLQRSYHRATLPPAGFGVHAGCNPPCHCATQVACQGVTNSSSSRPSCARASSA